MEVCRESGGPGCFYRVAPLYFGLVHEESEFSPRRLCGLEFPVAERYVQHPRLSNVFDRHPEDYFVRNCVMMRSEFLTDVDLGEKGLEHGGRQLTREKERKEKILLLDSWCHNKHGARQWNV